MGVFSPCSCLMTAERHADSGVSTISEGKEAVLGVCSGGRTGFKTAEGILSTTTSESKTQPYTPGRKTAATWAAWERRGRSRKGRKSGSCAGG